MSENQIPHPFEMKRDAQGKFIPPDFVNSPVAGPTVPTIDQAISQPESYQEPGQEPAEESSADQENPQDENTVEAAPIASVEKLERPSPRSPAKEDNLRRLREKNERIEAERDLMARELEMYRRAQGTHQNTAPKQQQEPEHIHEEEPDLNIGDDDLVEGKHLKKIIQQMQHKMNANNQQYAQSIAQSQQAQLEVQLKAQYPDFDAIVNQGNLKDLAAAYPELASTIYASKDLRSQAVTAYTMIKNLGINQQQDDPYEADKVRVKANAAKPRPSSSSSVTHASPLSQASSFSGGLTPELKAQMIKEMEQFRSR